MIRCPVAITGLGAVTGFGAGVSSLWTATLEDRSCIENGLGRISEQILSKLREKIKLPSNEQNNTALLISIFAIQEAMKQAGWEKLNSDDGFILATTTGQIPMWDRTVFNMLQSSSSQSDFDQFVLNQPLGSLIKKISQYFDFKGPSFLITSACAASTQALGLAQQWLQSGKVKRVLVGGTEVLCELTVNGFSSLQLLSEKNCQPFDKNRQGINLSEASAYLCLESVTSKTALAYLTGAGNSLDGHHMTAPHPEGLGTLKAMRIALKSAGLNPQDISWIHAHGTGSNHNDLSEGLAVQQLDSKAPVSSTKSVHGHALGAVGALESVLIVQALKEQIIIKTLGLVEPDPKIQISYVTKTQKQKLNHVLKSTAGFGGSNAALVFSHEL